MTLLSSPGPELRELQTRILRQDPALGGEPWPGVRAGAGAPPQTHYVQSEDGIHIAYQVLGRGERDIVFVPGLMSHLELLWEDQDTADFFRRLSSLGRLILFDKRDTGLSDRALRESSLEERMADVLAVMRAARSSQAVLFGYSEGAPMSILLAATHPERVKALILGSAAARWFPADGYPCGDGTQEMFESLWHIAEHQWGEGASIEWYLPSQAGSAHARRLFARFERLAISPSAFLRMMRMIKEIDVRAVLPALHVPTLVIQRLDDRITPPCHGRYLASHIAGARYFEQPGDHSLRFAGSGDSDALYAAIAEFLDGAPDIGDPGRVLTTILVAGPPDSAGGPADGAPGTVAAGARGAEPGFGPGVGARATADSTNGPAGDAELIRRIRSHHGRVITASGKTVMATFEAPGLAVRCAAAMRDGAAASGSGLRAGVHTGEVDVVGGDVSGAAVRFAYGIAALAGPGEILISRTVRDLVAGSGITVTDNGRCLPAGGDNWPLFAVIGL
jgi:pimeloyl-ACP methyl ester carboxylesterase